jgi:hypothetical protein
MRSASVIFACLAVAMPLVAGTFDFTAWPTVTLTGAAAPTSFGLAPIAGLTVGTASLAGFGGLLLAIKAGALLGAAARRIGKRSVVDEAQIGEQFIFDTIASMDAADCGKKYLCEIAATPVADLTQEELTSLLLFQTGTQAGLGKAHFNEAVRLGAISRNVKTCAARYQRCGVQSHETFTNKV